jgi:hypothetical protein
MKILRAAFVGMRGIRDVTLDLAHPETGAPYDLVALTGPAACGKTRALEAIFAAKEAIAPYGPAIDGAPWIASGTSARAAITWVLDEEEQTYAGTANPVAETDVVFLSQRTESLAFEGLRAVLERYTHGAHTGKVEYFPTTRRLSTDGAMGDLSAGAQRARRPTKAGYKYDFVGRFLRELPASPDVARAFAARLAALSPTCRYEPDGRTQNHFHTRNGASVGLRELSDAEADAVLFAATALAIDLACSIVLVDRPDLHADPAHAKQIVAGLRALGEGNQIILATGSPRFADAVAAAGGLVVALEPR